MEDEPEEKKPKNLAREILRNFVWLMKEVIKARPKSIGDLLDLRDRLFEQIWGSDLTIEDCQKLLYAFGPWDELKMAVLEARCSPLPDNKLPGSRTELLELSEKLLDRTDDFHMRIHFVAGWDGVSRESETAELNAFCDQLWGTRANDPEFFEAVVTGRHFTAVLYLANKRVPLGVTLESAFRLIYRMALIWCAHDVQAVAAQAHRSIKGPFSLLHGNVEADRRPNNGQCCRRIRWAAKHLPAESHPAPRSLVQKTFRSVSGCSTPPGRIATVLVRRAIRA